VNLDSKQTLTTGLQKALFLQMFIYFVRTFFFCGLFSNDDDDDDNNNNNNTYISDI
jgi:hypothetical protein